MAKKTHEALEKPKKQSTAKNVSSAKAKDVASSPQREVHDTRGMSSDQVNEIVNGRSKPKKPAKPKVPPPKTVNRSKEKSETNQEPAKRGRPTVYTPEIAAEICRRMAAGESVRKIGEDPDMPDESTIRGWALDDREGFFPQYTRAIQIRAMRWAEETVEIADDGSNDTYIDPETGEERINHEIVARSRLRVDTRKWITSKVLPKIYGDKLDVNHGVQPDNPLASLIQRIAGTGLPVVKDPKE